MCVLHKKKDSWQLTFRWCYAFVLSFHFIYVVFFNRFVPSFLCVLTFDLFWICVDIFLLVSILCCILTFPVFLMLAIIFFLSVVWCFRLSKFASDCIGIPICICWLKYSSLTVLPFYFYGHRLLVIFVFTFPLFISYYVVIPHTLSPSLAAPSRWRRFGVWFESWCPALSHRKWRAR